MKEITFFYMPGCPYCAKARRFIAALIKANPEYSAIPFKEIDEIAESELADQYDYYYVPAFYAGNEKIHEGDLDKKDMKAVLDAALIEK